MGASWLEVDKLIGELDTLTEFPHAEPLPSVLRARDVVAETVMVVSLAGLSEDPQAENERGTGAAACSRRGRPAPRR